MTTNRDWEFAQPSNLPEWLKDFANNKLEKSATNGNPFDEIRNLFKLNKGLSAVEQKVSELTQRIGLNKLNSSDEEKDIITTAKLWQLSKNPDQMVDDLDTLPISNSPVMWSTDQIISILRNKELMNKVKADDKLFKKFIKEIQDRKIDLKKVFQKLDIGDWREHGYFVLTDGAYPLGIYTNKEQANLARKTLINNIINGKSYIDSFTLTSILIDKGLNPSKIDQNLIDKEINELKQHPFYKNKRKEFAEEQFNVVKAPSDMRFSKESIIPSSQNIPNENQSISAESDLDNESEFSINLSELDNKHRDSLDEFYEDSAEKIKKRIEMEENGIDLDQMVDDKTAGLIKNLIYKANLAENLGNKKAALKFDKMANELYKNLVESNSQVLKEFPVLKIFIDNICRSRGGHVSLQAIIKMIRDERPEDIKISDELINYIKNKIKEEKKDILDSTSDMLAGTSVDVSKEEQRDANKMWEPSETL